MSPEQSIAHCRIGEGGMGAVYRATDTKLNRGVAIKILPEAFANNADRMARFDARGVGGGIPESSGTLRAIHGIKQGAIVMELVEADNMRGPMPCTLRSS